VVTDRWQTFTREAVTLQLLEQLSVYCGEFLIHGVDAEGKGSGMEEGLVRLLGRWEGCPITYAGGVSSFADLQKLYQLSAGRLDVTIGSALDLFGGTLPYQSVLEFVSKEART
jgi:phosphoribosylformimino-5-aminoimidazole carboxamide ribotide isomerase